MARIRDDELYKATHKTFEAYCVEKWDMSRSYVSRVIGASEVVANWQHSKLPPPSNEAQARALAKLAPKDQPKAWAEAVKTAPDGVVTFRATAPHRAPTPSHGRLLGLLPGRPMPRARPLLHSGARDTLGRCNAVLL
ncbi:MAG: hypothetical protein ABI548_25260 [Polyangiaceae bacterium]